jgi:hypothetical protein
MPKSFLEKIDDYRDSVFAIIGFANLFRFNSQTKDFNSNVKVAQGRKMRTSERNKICPDNTVTPDVLIQIDDAKGVVAEVKISFPNNQDFWVDDFRQLMKYDDDLTNWWTENLKVAHTNLVLLPHESRSVKVTEALQKKQQSGEIVLSRPFSIVEFHRSDQRKTFYFFRKIFGDIPAATEVSDSLKYGVQVPLDVLMLHYEKHKIYDSRPPMPYLLFIMWQDVISRWASEKPEFAGLRKNGKLVINATVDLIADEMYEYCSFKGFNYTEDENQYKVPLRNWVVDAIDALAKFQMAKWVKIEEGNCEIYFRKYGSIFEQFVDKCIEHNIDIADVEGVEYQPELFDKGKDQKELEP